MTPNWRPHGTISAIEDLAVARGHKSPDAKQGLLDSEKPLLTVSG